MADEFCLKLPDFHVTFRDLLHAVNLRHGTNGFTSLPKEGVLRIFSPRKIRRIRPGLNPRTWVQKASTLPLDHRSRTMRLTKCEKGVTWSIFVRNREKVRGSWRECITRGFVICTSPNTETVIKSRKMKWAGHVIIMVQKRNACFSRRTCSSVEHSENLGICGRKYCH